MARRYQERTMFSFGSFRFVSDWGCFPLACLYRQVYSLCLPPVTAIPFHAMPSIALHCLVYRPLASTNFQTIVLFPGVLEQNTIDRRDQPFPQSIDLLLLHG